MGQYKIQFNGKNWFLRGFTTQENAGDAYNATVNTELLNEAWKPTVDPTSATTLAGSWYHNSLPHLFRQGQEELLSRLRITLPVGMRTREGL